MVCTLLTDMKIFRGINKFFFSVHLEIRKHFLEVPPEDPRISLARVVFHTILKLIVVEGYGIRA